MEKQKQLHEIKDKRDDIEDQLIDINNLLSKTTFQPEVITKTETEFHKIIQLIEKINAENDAMKDLIKEKLTRVRELKDQENTIKTIQEEIDTLSDKIRFLNQFKNTLILTQEALRKELTLVLLGLFAETLELTLIELLTPIQMITFSVVTMLYIPCFATIIIIAKQTNWKYALKISVMEIAIALLIGGIINWGYIFFTNI